MSHRRLSYVIPEISRSWDERGVAEMAGRTEGARDGMASVLGKASVRSRGMVEL